MAIQGMTGLRREFEGAATGSYHGRPWSEMLIKIGLGLGANFFVIGSEVAHHPIRHAPRPVTSFDDGAVVGCGFICHGANIA